MQAESARRQEISLNCCIHTVTNAHFTASANSKWQVPTFPRKITIFCTVLLHGDICIIWTV
jgi:hypothetical protein